MLRNGLPVEPQVWPHRLGTENVVCLSLAANRNPAGYSAAVAPARFVGMPSIAYRMALVAVGECVAVVSLQHLSAWDFVAAAVLTVMGVIVAIVWTAQPGRSRAERSIAWTAIGAAQPASHAGGDGR